MNMVKKLRTAKGLTQEELADALCVSPQTVWGWENGKFNPKGKQKDTLIFYLYLYFSIGFV